MDPVRFVFGYIITPSCAMAGVITNAFNIVVFAADGLSQGNNFTLFTLSVLDCLISAYSTFAFSDFYYEGQSSKEMYMFQRGIDIGYTPLFGLKQASLLLTAKVVVGRYFVIKWPFFTRRFQNGMRLSVTTDIFLSLIGFSSIIWDLGYISGIVTIPAKNLTKYIDSTDSNGNFTLQAVIVLTKESYRTSDDYAEQGLIAWFYLSNSIRVVALIVVSTCGVSMVVELRRHSARLYKTAGNDVEEGVSDSTRASSSSSIRRNDTQTAMPNFISIAQNRINKVALGTAALFMANMVISMAQFALSFYSYFIIDNCHNCQVQLYNLAVNPLYMLNQLHGFGFTLIYSFSFLIYFRFNKRFKLKFLAIFCGCSNFTRNAQKSQKATI